MQDREILRERAQNIWTSATRKFESLDQATQLDPLPETGLEEIGGLAGPKDEIQTYACAVANPTVYANWGTVPPSGLLLIGQRGVGKRLLARALASLTGTAFLTLNVPKLVLEVIHRGGKVGDLVNGWSQTLAEMPPITVFFDELEFSQAEEIGARRPDLPVGPVMDFLLDLVDRTIGGEGRLVVGSTSHPDTIRHAFAQPGRFERIVEVNPIFPDDIVEALKLHALRAEKDAGRTLFEPMDWEKVVGGYAEPATGDWIRIMHAVLRRKARCEAAGEDVQPVSSEDFLDEVRRHKQARTRMAVPQSGNYV